MKQTTLIHRTEWDILIILDACRYDYFKNQHKNHLKGTLKKAMSPASDTTQWLKRTWKDKYDLTYLSANPYINTKGVPTGNFIARNHFKKIVDVWDFGWSDALGTVHPKEMNVAVMSTSLGEKMVIHYMQPHRPYLGKHGEEYSRAASPIRQRLLGKPMPPKGSHRFPHRHQLKQAYADTLDLVLSYVAKITPHLSGKVVISADHGELLGELIDEVRFWGRHPQKINHLALREVPWFEVKK